MSESNANHENDDEDLELRQALMAAFGDEALGLLDDDNDFDEMNHEVVDDSVSTPQEQLTSDLQLVREKTTPQESDSDRVRWIKKLSAAIYSSSSSSHVQNQNANGTVPDRYVLFSIGGKRVGLPMASVREIARYPKVTKLPRTPVWLRGISSFRGQIVSVTDLKHIFEPGKPAESQPAGEKIIVVNDATKSQCTALVVEQVLGIRNYKGESASPPESNQQLAALPTTIATIDGKPTYLLEPGALFMCVENLLLKN